MGERSAVRLLGSALAVLLPLAAAATGGGCTASREQHVVEATPLIRPVNAGAVGERFRNESPDASDGR